MKSESSESPRHDCFGKPRSMSLPVVLCFAVVTVLAILSGLLIWLNHGPTIEELFIAGGICLALIVLIVVSTFFMEIYSHIRRRHDDDEKKVNITHITMKLVSLPLLGFFATWCPNAKAEVGATGDGPSMIVYSVKLFPMGTKVTGPVQPSGYELLSLSSDVGGVAVATHQIVATEMGGTNVVTLSLDDAELSIDFMGRKSLQLTDGSAYTIISSGTNDLMLVSSSGALYEVEPNSTVPLLCVAIGVGVGATIWLGYKIGKCLYKMITNYNNRISNKTDSVDSAYLSSPPSAPTSDNILSSFSPSSLAGSGTMVVSHNMTEDNRLYGDVSTNGWLDQQGYLFSTQYITVTYATNLAISPVNDPSSVTSCRFYERSLVETTMIEVISEPVAIVKTWVSYNNGTPINALTTISWRGVRFFTNYSSITFLSNNATESVYETTPGHTLSGWPVDKTVSGGKIWCLRP